MCKPSWAAVNADPLSYVRQMEIADCKKAPLHKQWQDWGWGGGLQ